ncbi:MAG: extracellular solute-binding protein [Treponema sp.]|nr:extracellular solute-binding protein [Treponema sp.]
MKKKDVFITLTILLTVMLLTPCFAGGGGQANTAAAPAKIGADPLFNPTGDVLAKEKVTLNFVACRPANFRNGWADMQVIQDLEKITNVHMNWIEIEESAWAEKTRLMLASSDLPDAFYSWPIADNVVQEYGEQGILVPLEPYIDAYGYNITKAFKELPALRPAMTYPDGHIYALPMANIGENGGNYIWINTDWLKQTGLSMPKTTEDFYNVLKAFKTLHPDVAPFTFTQYTPAGLPHLQQGANNLFGSFGVVYDDRYLMWQNNTVIFAPSQPGYLEGLRYFNRLYKEGLIDPESFSQTIEQMQAKTRSDLSRGATVSHMADFIVDLGGRTDTTMEEYNALRFQPIAPLIGPSGAAPIWRKYISFPIENTGRFMITNINKHPEISMRWVDYSCDNDAHANNLRLGPQGLFWDYMNPEKTKFGMIYSDKINTNLQYNPVNYCVWFWLPSYNTKNVRVPQQEMQSINYENLVKPYAIDNVPSVKFTSDENNTMSGIRVDLFKYVASSFTSFIMNGVTDAQWNDYLAKLKTYGSDTYTQIYQTAVNRSFGK